MILFINACVRGEESRTLELCREYLAGVHRAQPNAEICEVDLGRLHLEPLDAQKVAFRSQLASAGKYDDPIFNLAHQFAAADDIVIGAPYWDLTFPAALKTYIEHVSVDNVTFRFTPDAHYIGLSSARRITYITTSGSLLTCEDAIAGTAASVYAKRGENAPAPGCNLGFDYMCAIARMFGIPEVRYVAAEGLDIAGIDIAAQMDKARAQIARLLAADTSC